MTATSAPSRSLRKLRLSAFDRMVALIVVLLVAGIGLTILLGDRVGVTVERAAPLGEARSTSRVVIQFSEVMQRDTVAERLSLVALHPDAPADVMALTPDDLGDSVTGSITWNGRAMIFQPDTALQPGGRYGVFLQPGAQADTGRAVLAEYRFAFTVRRPRVAYLAPASGSPFNIWIADPTDPESAQQVTFSPAGIFDFGVSPDGTKIAFSERNTNTGTADIKLLDLETGGLEQLTNCADSDCTTPVWRPDGQIIAYQRVDFNTGLNVPISPTRTWLIDLSTTPATTRPLFDDSQILGYGLQWSADGSKATLYDSGTQSILLYDLNEGSIALVSSNYGNSGALSPDGTKLVFTTVLFEPGTTRNVLQIADFSSEAFSDLSHVDELVDDDAAVWSPDGSLLAVARRYTDDRYTRGRQIYLMDPATGDVQPLVVDPRYANGFFSFDPSGQQLVIQRFPELTEDGTPNNAGVPEIWTVSLASGILRQIKIDGFHPRWVP
ncbi:MAG: PD40 domain-containing protein [Anaerolineaceae bacterium]|nr:PD40 domain-containing protein [Anaerolineaceae bacterium]